MTVRLELAKLSPYQEIADYQAARLSASADIGATAVFIGTMRDFNEGDSVLEMTLEHYPGMTEKQLAAIQTEAEHTWPILDVLICHRVGNIRPRDPIVAVAVWAHHRAESFEACRFIVEALKSRAPFWKKEKLPDRSRWVEHNTDACVSRSDSDP